MLVYRIECDKGEGIYSAGFGHKFTRAALEGHTNPIHPSPEEEAALRDFWLGTKLSRNKQTDWELRGRREWFCGFESMDQLLEWFPREGLYQMWNAMLRRGRGVRLVTYKVHANQAKCGKHQLVFRKSKAEVLESKPLERFVPFAA